MAIEDIDSLQLMTSYGDNDYFAFVESSEEIPKHKTPRNFQSYPEEWHPILYTRKNLDLKLPNAALWFDCVKANYFASLGWSGDSCQINNKVESQQRWKHLMELDASQFVVSLILLDTNTESERFDYYQFNKVSWCLIRLDSDFGTPARVAPDFDLDPEYAKSRYATYARPVFDVELKKLANVFNLNFLPDAGLEGEEPHERDIPPSNGNGQGEEPVNNSSTIMSFLTTDGHQGHD